MSTGAPFSSQLDAVIHIDQTRALEPLERTEHGELPEAFPSRSGTLSSGGAETLDPAAIVITHAHPDHAGGLRHGAPCPVYATAEIWETMPRWKLPAREGLRHERARVICGLRITPFAVVHSLRTPAVGYRISARGARLSYVPDVVSIPREREALSGIDIYVGDGASLVRPILRVREGTLIGAGSMPASPTTGCG